LIQFHLTGPGRLVAVDNANVASHEPFQATQRHAYHGTCVAYVRPTSPGPLTVTAETPGLPAASLTGVTPATP
jgi:beta-galactosidase